MLANRKTTQKVEDRQNSAHPETGQTTTHRELAADITHILPGQSTGTRILLNRWQSYLEEEELYPDTMLGFAPNSARKMPCCS